MQIAIITPTPNIISTFVQTSIVRKSINNKVINLSIINLRDFGIGTYRQIDDAPFGGGDGMVMMAKPLQKAIEHAINLVGGTDNLQIIFPSPQGEKWDQKSAETLSKIKKIILICGHYKGIDERIINKYVTKQISMGDYILTNGEIPAMVILDSISRLMPGTLNNLNSALTDSFSYGLLDHPHFTQPREFEGMSVPDVLLSGHHKNIQYWRKNIREKLTKEKRPDLWESFIKVKESEC